MITGPQGSGKTTQVKILSEKLGLCMVKLGDLLREKAKHQDAIGQRIDADISQGKLTDNKIVAETLKNELSHPKCASGFIVDGYPRSVAQLEEFDPKYNLVIYLDLNLEEAKKRLLNRGREDDTPEAIKKRFEWFEKETEKVVDYYQKLGILIKIDGEKSIEKVTEDILSALKEHGQHKS